MSACVIIDAGPSLTFYAAGKQGLLHAAMTAISHELVVPEIIQTEVLSKADRDPCFSSVRARFERDIAAERLAVISDDRGAELAAVIVEVQRFIRGLKKDGNGDPVSLDAPLSAEDRGEATVIAHAELYRQQGRSVRILIDEWRGQKAAQVRGFSVIDSTTILLKAAKLGLIADRGQMRSIWTRFQELDFSHTHWSLNPRLHDRSIYRTEVPADEAP